MFLFSLFSKCPVSCRVGYTPSELLRPPSKGVFEQNRHPDFEPSGLWMPQCEAITGAPQE